MALLMGGGREASVRGDSSLRNPATKLSTHKQNRPAQAADRPGLGRSGMGLRLCTSTQLPGPLLKTSL